MSLDFFLENVRGGGGHLFFLHLLKLSHAHGLQPRSTFAVIAAWSPSPWPSVTSYILYPSLKATAATPHTRQTDTPMSSVATGYGLLPLPGILTPRHQGRCLHQASGRFNWTARFAMSAPDPPRPRVAVILPSQVLASFIYKSKTKLTFLLKLGLRLGRMKPPPYFFFFF